MALSGSFVGAASSSSPGKFYRLRVDWSATQSVANNTSTITCNFYLEQDNSWSISIGGRSNTCTIDGTVIGWTSPTVSNGGGTTTHIGSCSRTVNHNADGTKTLTLSATYNTAPLTISNTAINSITASATVTLDTIARASAPTVSTSSVAMRDGSVRIYTNRASESFTHTLSYTFGNASGTIATGIMYYEDWTPPMDLAYQIPSSTQGTLTIYCDTYSGGTLVGTKSVNLTVTVPADVTPYAEILNRGDATAAYVTLGTYVQNVSRLNLHIGNSGTYGSYVTGVGITLNGKAFSSGGLITGSGNLTLRITVTDSRGRSSFDEEIISVAPYKEPQLTLTAHRCDANGTANDAGEYAKIIVSGSTTQVNNRNTAKCELTLGSGNPVNLGIGTGSFSKEQIVAVSSEETLAISATLSDSLSKLLKPATRSMVLSTGFATMDFLAGGRGIAFGATATKKGFTCAMDTDFAGHTVTGVQLYYHGSNGIDLDNVRSNIFAINAKNAPFSHGAVTCHRLQGGGFTPTDTKDIIIQEMEEWSTHKQARRKSFDGGATWQPWENDALKLYPVGSIYMSLNSTSPANLFGGTWERILQRFLFAAHDSGGYYGGTTGGEATHKLTVDEMPSHSHTPKGWAYQVKTDGSSSIVALTSDYTTVDNWSPPTNAVGGGQAHNNMPPYLAVYMWKRVA